VRHKVAVRLKVAVRHKLAENAAAQNALSGQETAAQVVRGATAPRSLTAVRSLTAPRSLTAVRSLTAARSLTAVRDPVDRKKGGPHAAASPSRRAVKVAAAQPVQDVINAGEKDGDVTAAMTTKIEPEGWEEPQTILVVLAHPDDPEFFCGATIARWARMGHTVHYCLLTRGDKGVRDRKVDPGELARMREGEQRGAADVLGVKEILFLDFEDGYLVPDLASRKAVTRAIRRFHPDIVVSCDPTYVFGENNINHPDHRAAGQIVIDAIFPAVGNPMYFPDLIEDDHLEPVPVKEVWLSVTGSPNTVIDVTDYWETKIEALHHHLSQISDVTLLDERIRGRHTPDSTLDNPRYEERFRRLKFR
jgi:LmbE family N-acetylglucosaminyl deacetylase